MERDRKEGEAGQREATCSPGPKNTAATFFPFFKMTASFPSFIPRARLKLIHYRGHHPGGWYRKAYHTDGLCPHGPHPVFKKTKETIVLFLK